MSGLFSRLKRQLQASFVWIATGAMLLSMVPMPAQATVETQSREVTICHSTSSAGNPYNILTVDESAVDGVGMGDHYRRHKGPIYSPGASDWGDIIPPVSPWHDGLNWTPEGQAILANDCEIPETTVDVTMVKVVEGGPASPSDWDQKLSLKAKADGERTRFDHNEEITMDYGQYDLEEMLLPNYTLDSVVCIDEDKNNVSDNMVLYLGDNVDGDVTCTFINEYEGPSTMRVKLVKRVINNDDGQLRPGAWDQKLSLTQTFDPYKVYTFDHNEVMDLPYGTYTASEQLIDGYNWTMFDCRDGRNVKFNDGHSVFVSDKAIEGIRCTFTNDDVTPESTVTVVKRVRNNDGGDLGPRDFTLKLNTSRVRHGEPTVVKAGSWNLVSELPEAGYTYRGTQCVDAETKVNVGNPFRIRQGQDVVCTILNDDIAPKVRLYKQVENDDGGMLGPKDFQLTLNGHDAPQAEWIKIKANTDYKISEDEVHGYEIEEIRCKTLKDHKWVDLDLPLNLLPGQWAVCTVVNDDIPPEVEISKHTQPYMSSQAFNFELHDEKGYVEFTLDTDDYDKTYPSSESFEVYAGDVKLSEEAVAGWSNVYLSCEVYSDDNEHDHIYGENYTVAMNIGVGDRADCHFVNVQLGEIKVTKFFDANQNGEWDEGEEALSDWEMNLTVDTYSHEMNGNTRVLNGYDPVHDQYVLSQDTGSDGMTTFSGLLPSNSRNPQVVYSLSETLQDGWEQTGYYCDPLEYEEEYVESADDNGNGEIPEGIEVVSGMTTNCYFGNYQEGEVLGETTEGEVLAETGTPTIAAMLTGVVLASTPLALTTRRKED